MEERIFLVNDRGRVRENYRNHVKSDAVPVDARARDVTTGGALDMLLLLAVDGALGGAKLGGAARFHFDKDDAFALARHDIDFGIAAGTVIPGDHRESGSAQIAMCQIFAAPSQSSIRSQRLSLPELPRLVAQFPEQLPGLDSPAGPFTACSRHSMTLPRMR